MIYLEDVREWLKTFEIAENYYVGKLSTKNEKSLGVYQLKRTMPPNRAYGGRETYETKGISLLLHWNKNATETERTAYKLYEKLRAVSSLRIGGTHIYILELLTAEPEDVGTDDNGVFERVIELKLYYEKE